MKFFQTFNKKIRFFLPYKGKIFATFLLSLFSSLFFLAAPYLSKLCIDGSFLKKDLRVFLKVSLLSLIFFLFSTASNLVQNIIKKRLSTKVNVSLSRIFIKKFYSLDLEFFMQKSVGENIYRISDVRRISKFILEDVPSLLADFCRFPVIMVISLYVNIQLTIFMLLVSPLFLVNSLYIRNKLRPLSQKQWKGNMNISKKLQEAFSRIVIIKSLGCESYESRSYIKHFINSLRLENDSFRWSTISSLVSMFLTKAIYGLVTLYGGWLIIKGRLSLGSYAAVMLYINQLGGLIQSLTNRLSYFAQENVVFVNFFETMDVQTRIKDSPWARDISSLRGRILFENVSFGYEKDKAVLKGFNINIPPGIFIGIAGPSGCGKTTMINLLLRLYLPWEGRIVLSGFALDYIKLKSFREKISVATQEPLLFDLTLKENIGYGLSGCREGEIIEAAGLVQAHDFIANLPKGYETLIGENASRLSQGYKQRIALARAIIREPDLLILDEATASIDSFTEDKIMRGLKTRRQGRSTLVVSHRLSTIRGADRIYFFSPAGGIENGSHDELMVNSEEYAKFFQSQTEQKLKIASPPERREQACLFPTSQ